MKMFKKAQIKLFESIAVLIVFVFLVSIGMRFYSSIQMQDFEDAQRDFFQMNSIKASTIISHLPEITCSFAGTSETACFDLHKIYAWNSLMSDSQNIVFANYYLPLLGNSEIVVEEVYPLTNSWIIYNNSLESSFDYMRIPITIYDPVTKKNSVGVMHVKTYYE